MIAKAGTRSIATERRAFGPAGTTTGALTTAGTRLRPYVEYVVEIGHALHALGQIVMQRGEELVVAQLRIVYLLLVERCLRRL